MSKIVKTSTYELDKYMWSGFIKLTTELDRPMGNIEREKVFAKYVEDYDLYHVVRRVWDPQSKTHVKRASIEKHDDEYKAYPDDAKYKSFTDLWDYLVALPAASKDAKQNIIDYMAIHPEAREIILNFLDKRPGMHISVKTLEKMYSDIFNVHVDVVLAQGYEKYKSFFEESVKKDKWYISRKRDGIRWLFKVETPLIDRVPDFANISITSYSRRGRTPIECPDIECDIKKLLVPTMHALYPTYAISADNKTMCFVMDCEVYRPTKRDAKHIAEVYGDASLANMHAGTDSEEEAFKSIQSELRRKDNKLANARVSVLDIITCKEFHDAVGIELFNVRYDRLTKVINASKSKLIEPMIQIEYSQQALDTERAKSEEYGWEGLILRRNSGYEAKRTKDLLKIKNFLETNVKVLEVLNNEIEIFDKKLNKYVKRDVASRIRVQYKNNDQSFVTISRYDDRIYYYENPDELVGKTVSVSYFEETMDKNGKPNMRFPVLRQIEGREREY